MIQNDISNDLFNNDFSRDCREIIVTDEKTNDILFKGPGEISKRDNENFNIKLYCTTSNRNIFELSNEQSFQFNALDINGNKWKFSLIHIQVQNFLNDDSGVSLIITGKFYRLELITRIPKGQCASKTGEDYVCIQLKSFDHFPFTNKPKNSNESYHHNHSGIVNYNDDLLSIKSVEVGDIVQLLMHFHKKITNENIEWLSREGLQFVLGRKINPIMVQCYFNKSLTTTFLKGDYHYNSSVYSPIYLDHLPYKKTDSLWELFSKYLQFVSNFKAERYSKLGATINSIVSTGNGFLETNILVLCVAVESLVKNIYNHSKKSIKNFLYSLEKENIVTEDEINAWHELRTDSAHATLDVKSKESGYYHFEYLKVLEMFYKLIFYKIGYRGIYTPLGSKNIFDIKNYNPK